MRGIFGGFACLIGLLASVQGSIAQPIGAPSGPTASAHLVAPLQLTLSDSGIDPLFLVAPKNANVTLTNKTSHDIALTISGSPSNLSLTVSANSTVVQEFSTPGLQWVADAAHIDQQAVVSVTDNASLPAVCSANQGPPSPAIAPKPLPTVAAPTCAPFNATAPGAVRAWAPPPLSAAANIKSYFGDLETPSANATISPAVAARAYNPGRLERGSFGYFSAALGSQLNAVNSSGFNSGASTTVDDNQEIVVTRPGGWRDGTQVTLRAITDGIHMSYVSPFTVVGYGNCSRPPIGSKPTVLPFDPTLTSNVAVSFTPAPSTDGGKTYVFEAQKMLFPHNPNLCDPSGTASIVAIKILVPSIVFDASQKPWRGFASSIALSVTVDGLGVGEYPVAVFRPADFNQSTPGPIRHAWLTTAADMRGGLAYVSTGEYVSPFHIFSTRGQQYTLSLDLTYSSFESLLYSGAASLPNADRFVAAPFGQGWSYTYGIRVLYRSDLDVEMIGPRGERTQMYLASGAATSWVADLGSLSWFAEMATLEKTSNGYRLWSATSPDEYQFNAEGLLTEIKRRAYGQPLSIKYQRNAGRSTDQIVTDSGGKVVKFTFEDGHIAKVTDPLGSVWSFKYTGDSLTQVLHGPSGYIWQFSYDTKSFLLTTIADPDCITTELKYSDGTEPGIATFGSFLGSSTSAQGKRQSVSIDYLAADKVVVTDIAGQQTIFSNPVYSGVGFLTGITVTDAKNQPHRLTGRDGRLVTEEFPPGKMTQWSLGSAGLKAIIYPDQSQLNLFLEAAPNTQSGVRLTKAWWNPSNVGDDTSSKEYNYQYDNFDRLRFVVFPDDDPTNPRHALAYTYDSLGRIQTATDPEGRVVTFSYGSDPGQQNLIATTTQADNSGNIGTLKYTYDALGNVKTMTDARNYLWQYDYDSLGRLIKTTAPPSAEGAIVEQFSYDPLGRLRAYRNPRGFDTVIAPDPLGQSLEILYPGGIKLSSNFDPPTGAVSTTNVLGGDNGHQTGRTRPGLRYHRPKRPDQKSPI
jgi:YD repeat-containing protein